MSDLWHSVEGRERLKKSQSVWIAACVMMSLVLVLLVALNPGFAVREVQDSLLRRSGLELQAAQSRLTVMPFGLEMKDVKILAGDGSGRQIVSAPIVRVPLQWRSLLTRKIKLASVEVQQPVATLVVDQNGSLGWSGKGDAIDTAVTQNSVPGEPLKILVTDGSFQLFDQRSQQSFQVEQTNASLEIDRAGRLDLAGTVSLAQQFTQVEAHIASLARLADDGTPFDLMLKASPLQVNFSGRLSLQGALSMAGTFTAASDNFANVLQWAGRQKVPEGLALPINLAGPVDLTGKIVKSPDLTLTAGSTTLKGKLAIDLSGAVPRVSGQLSTDALRLALPAARTQAANESTPEPVLTETRFDLSSLSSLNADLGISAFTAALGPVALGATTLSIKGENGSYTFGLDETGMLGGTGGGSLHLDGASAVPQAALRFTGHGIDATQLLSLFGGKGWLQGTGDVSLDVSGAGITGEEMISTLKGKAELSMPKGQIAGVDIAGSIQQAASNLVEGWLNRTDAATAVTNATAQFTVQDGIAAIDQGSATVAGVDLKASGDVDLLRRAIDLRLVPAESGGLAVRAVGPWQKPRLKADISDVVGIPGVEIDGKDVNKAAKKAKKLFKKVIGN